MASAAAPPAAAPAAPIDPAALRPHYASFLAGGGAGERRILLTGHSHQAWPDVARAGLLEAFDDAAAAVDEKWARVFAVLDRVRAAIAARIGGRPGDYALAGSTHDLVVRFLSALDWRRRRHLVTTTGEFHSIDRQLCRLGEEAAVEVSFVEAAPVATLAERLASALRDDTAAVLASSVHFETSARVPGLAELTAAARARGIEVLIDAYHAFNVVPFEVDALPGAFVVAGGYKYAQWGEGVCFMRVPPGCPLRPICTGWFAGFDQLADARGEGRAQVAYAADGATRFAGATFDPTSHYRAAAVAALFDAQALTVPRLRALSLRQTARLIAGLDRAGLAVVTPRDDDARAGFVAARVADPAAWVAALRAEGIASDARGDLLRLGPAPYVTDDELDAALAAIARLASRA